jgi:hypothetical protein
VGLFAGAAVGAISCGLFELSEFVWVAALVAAAAGFVGGGFIGARQMRNPKKGCKPLHRHFHLRGLLAHSRRRPPAGSRLRGLGGLGFAGGKFGGYLLLGVAFGMPMAASLVGAILDRIYENYLRRRER